MHNTSFIRKWWLSKASQEERPCDSDSCYYITLIAKVMTGSLQIEDLQKLDKMVNDFDAIRENGPNKILRGKFKTISLDIRT